MTLHFLSRPFYLLALIYRRQHQWFGLLLDNDQQLISFSKLALHHIMNSFWHDENNVNNDYEVKASILLCVVLWCAWPPIDMVLGSRQCVEMSLVFCCSARSGDRRSKDLSETFNRIKFEPIWSKTHEVINYFRSTSLLRGKIEIGLATLISGGHSVRFTQMWGQ